MSENDEKMFGCGNSGKIKEESSAKNEREGIDRQRRTPCRNTLFGRWQRIV